MKWIDEIIYGLVEVVGSSNIYDIIDHLRIKVFTLNHENTILQGNEAVYTRFGALEIIYISDRITKSKEFILAHEVGHALLHVEEMEVYFNPLLNKGKLENEANYFATKLLYKDLVIEDGIETKQQLADSLGVNEEVINYIINK